MEKSVRVCDLDDADQRIAVETLSIVIGGEQHRLDLCGEHLVWAKSLPVQKASGQPAAAARASRRKRAASPEPADSTDAAGSRRPGSRRSLQQERTAVREWARSQGREIADRGRLPDGLVDEYRSATSASA